jgi:hypothetical protein
VIAAGADETLERADLLRDLSASRRVGHPERTRVDTVLPTD